MENPELSGLDKAAILFQVLGDGLAVTIFKDINDTELRKIRIRARELVKVPFLVKKAVLEEFYFGFLTDRFKDTSAESREPFAFLEKLNDEQVAYLILSESPRVMGVVLAQLSPEQQMHVYSRLDPELRIEALMELGETETLNLEAVVSIAGDLEEKARYIPKAAKFERGGGEKLANMLGQMQMEKADLFLEKLEQEDPELFKQVKRYYLTFDDIFRVPDSALRDILVSVEIDDIAIAMKGFDEDVVNRVIDTLPKKKQAMYEPVEGAISKREVVEARRKIMVKVREMQAAGEINMADLLSGEMID